MWTLLAILAIIVPTATAVQATVAQSIIFAPTNNSNYVSLGVLTLTQNGSTLSIKGTLTPSGGVAAFKDGSHGFHVHQYGKLTNSCLDAGGHFNPDNVTHGGPNATTRHVGDLGNVVSQNNIINIDITDTVASLTGQRSIVGLAFVLHDMPDDLGLGNATDSLTTGNAGARIGCGVIGVTTQAAAGLSSLLSLAFASLLLASKT